MIQRILSFKSFRDVNPYLVGLLSVGFIGAFVAIALAVGILHLFEDTYTVRALFPDAAGARNGDDVRVAGIQVGRITDIEPDRSSGNVEITFVVDSGIDLPTKPNAELVLTTLLGTKFVRLTGDVPSTGPYLADLPEAERVIPVERTKIPVEILALVSLSSRQIQATDTEGLNRLVGSLADVTEGTKDDIATLVEGLDQVAGALNDRDAELRRLLDRADRFTKILAEKDDTLLELVAQSKKVLSLIVDRRDDVSANIRDSERLIVEVARVVGTHKSFLDSLLETLHPALASVAAHQEELDIALSYLGPGALGLAAGGGRGPFTDIYVAALGPLNTDILEILDGLS